MNDANTSSTAFSMPFSYVQHLLIFGLENWQSPKIRRNPGGDRTRDGNEERLSRARERERERAKESDGVLGRARQLRLPTMAAQGGLQLRVSSRREKRQVEREREREAERRSVTGRYALRSSAPTREERKRETERGSSTDRPTIACLTC